MGVLKRIARSRPVQATVGVAVAEYLRFVWLTSRIVLDPPDIYEQMVPQLPVIIAMWHGQHFMVPFIRRGYAAKVLISRHRDGEVNAVTAHWLGLETIRGSGNHGRITVERQRSERAGDAAHEHAGQRTNPGKDR